MENQEVKNAIITTLSYRKIFNYPLSFYELYNTLAIKKTTNIELFSSILKDLVEDKNVYKLENFFSLQPIDLDSKIEYETRSKYLLIKATKVTAFLSKIPFIKFIGVTGSVAALNSPKGADIDILIISSKSSVWLTRFFVVLTLKILNLYWEEGNESGKICPNILLDESNLEWPDRNIYTAHEIILMKPLYIRDNLYFKFLTSNSWIRDYFPHLCFEHVTSLKIANVNLVQKMLENIIRKIQINYMKKKKTVEITTETFIHFKKHDHSKNILNQFENNTL